LEENENKTHFSLIDFSETQSNQVIGAGLIECDNNQFDLNRWKSTKKPVLWALGLRYI
jgi:hypothetical protein